jgi:outer membrane protease
MRPHRYLRARRDAKGKAAFSSNSKLMPDQYWNESKLASLSQITLAR